MHVRMIAQEAGADIQVARLIIPYRRGSMPNYPFETVIGHWFFPIFVFASNKVFEKQIPKMENLFTSAI